LIAIGALSVWLLWPQPPLQSLAVLPFINESGDEDAAFLCDGIAESIINRLATISDLRVVPSSTAFHFRGEDDLDRVAQAMKVRAILTGRLTRIGGELTIRVSLDDMHENRRLWGHPFRGRLDNVLEVETDIADRVAEELRLRLTEDERSRLARGGTTVADARLAYMRGRHFWWTSNSQDSMWKAASHFEQAIDLDREYARPYCGLVDTMCILAAWGALQPLQIRSEMQARVDTALALDDTLAEAHASAGLVAMYLNWDWAGAEEAFKRAIALNQDLAIAYLEYGRMLAWVGRYDEAEEQYRKGIEANPVSLTVLTGVGMLYAGTGRLDKAEEVLKEALVLDADHHEALVWRGVVRQRQRRFDEAVTLVEQSVLTREQPELALLGFLGNAYAMAGRMDDARDVLIRMQQMKHEEPAHHLWFAEIYAALGEVEEAFVQLDKAVAAREAWLPNLRFEPGLVHLRDDPRFAEVHRKMGLVHVDFVNPPTTP
jgi:TolB-like protein/Flp pilus assembly protein TadD